MKNMKKRPYEQPDCERILVSAEAFCSTVSGAGVGGVDDDNEDLPE